MNMKISFAMYIMHNCTSNNNKPNSEFPHHELIPCSNFLPKLVTSRMHGVECIRGIRMQSKNLKFNSIEIQNECYELGFESNQIRQIGLQIEFTFVE